MTTNIIQSHTKHNYTIMSWCFKFEGLVDIFKTERIFINQRAKYSNPRRKIDICRKSTEEMLKVKKNIFNSIRDENENNRSFYISPC